jgi:hypothetical protein
MLSVVVAVIAVWQMRRLPRLQLRRRAEQKTT